MLTEYQKIIILMVLGFIIAHCISLPILYAHNMLNTINYLIVLLLGVSGTLFDQLIYLTRCVSQLKKDATMMPKHLEPYSLQRTFFASFGYMTVTTVIMVCLV